MQPYNFLSDRVLILAPRGRDTEVIQQVLQGDGFKCQAVSDFTHMLGALNEAASAAIIAEEAVQDIDIANLRDWLSIQEPWSDFPFILLVSKATRASNAPSADQLAALGNVILLERPLNAQTLIRATASALRARHRQFQARDVLQMREEAKQKLLESQQELQLLNGTLEHRILDRTKDLAQANDRLMSEIAERERIQQSLIQTQKMEAIGHLTGGIAHDFNNLLSIIQGNMDLILMLSADERTKRMANVARKATRRGAKLTAQLLAFSRTQQLDLKPTQLKDVISNVEELILSSVGSGIQVELDISDELPLVIADGSQIELAVLNLAINARDAMRGDGKLSISTEVRRGEGELPSSALFAVLKVIDTGEGIAPEIIEQVFNPFFTTKPVGKGTGLGLSQVYGITQQSGGSVSISSELNVGTSVEMWLRLAAENEVAPTPIAGEAYRTGSHAEAKVLVVEDEPDVRQFMVDSLEVLGYAVVQAEHGEAGYQQLLKERPDVLITDFLMPGMNGAELILKASIDFPTIPVILATGYADSGVRQAPLDGNTVLRKPFKFNELANAVEKALSSARRDRQALDSHGVERSAPI